MNILLDTSRSMVSVMEAVKCGLYNMFLGRNDDPYWLEVRDNIKDRKYRLCTFDKDITISTIYPGSDLSSIKVSKHSDTNLGKALEQMNNIGAFNRNSINIVVIDGEISDKTLFLKQAKITHSLVKSNDDYPTFITLAIGPIADSTNLQTLLGYGYSIKDISNPESVMKIKTFFRDIVHSYNTFFPSLSINAPLVNQWRPQFSNPLKLEYEINI